MIFATLLLSLPGLAVVVHSWGEAAALPPAAPVGATVAGSVMTVRARLFAALQGAEVPLQTLSHPELGRQFQAFVLYTNEAARPSIDATFQPVDKLGSTDFSAPPSTARLPPGTADAALVAYLALPPAARAHDLLVQHGRLGYDQYWRAPEYQSAGPALPYRADYILHFAPDGTDRTYLEVIAFGAWVLDGKEWRVTAAQDGLGLPWPRRVDKQRDVLPSRADKQTVLAALLKLLD